MLCGDFESAIEQFEIAQSVYVPEHSFHHGLSVLYLYKGLLFLWDMKPQEAYECAQQAHRFSTKDSLERESIGADWLTEVSLIEMFSRKSFGKRVIGTEIESRLTYLLTRCRQINLVELEPDVLLARARWYYLYGNLQEALKDVTDALVVASRCEYRLKQADIHNFLAQLALEQEKDKVKAKEYAETALKLAYCDGPPYYYKVAYEEAERMLAGL